MYHMKIFLYDIFVKTCSPVEMYVVFIPFDRYDKHFAKNFAMYADIWVIKSHSSCLSLPLPNLLHILMCHIFLVKFVTFYMYRS